MSILLYVSIVAIVIIVLLGIGLGSAQEGWEDERGFHRGKKM